MMLQNCFLSDEYTSITRYNTGLQMLTDKYQFFKRRSTWVSLQITSEHWRIK